MPVDQGICHDLKKPWSLPLIDVTLYNGVCSVTFKLTMLSVVKLKSLLFLGH